MREIGIGIIGWGFMGQTHTYAIKSIPLLYPGIPFVPRLTAVCDYHISEAREAALRNGFGFATDDYRELLRRDDVHVVSVSTPNELHAPMVADALRAGKHVYVDKPMTSTLEEARTLLELQRALHDCPKLQVVHHNRFFPSSMRARQLIDQGALGEILSFRVTYLHSGAVDRSRPAGWKQRAGAGVLLDLGSHALDFILWLMGPVTAVSASMRTLYPTRPLPGGGETQELADDQVIALLRLEGGALGTMEASKIATGAADELKCEIHGSRGALRWDLMAPDWLEFYDNTLPEEALGGSRGYVRIECGARFPAPGGKFLPPKNTLGWARAHIHCYYSFLEAIAQDRQPSPSLEEGVCLAKLMRAVELSSQRGGWVDV